MTTTSFNLSPKTQQKLGNYAGHAWTLGNIILPAYKMGQIAVNFANTGQLDLSTFTNQPFDALSGIVFMGSSTYQSKLGHTNKGGMIAQSIATVGYGLLTAHTIQAGYGWAGIGAALLGVGCTAYNAVKLGNRSKTQEKQDLFTENKNSLFKKFPLLVGMLPIAISSATACVSAIIAKDMPLATTAFSWLVGDICLGLSAPKNTPSKANTP